MHIIEVVTTYGPLIGAVTFLVYILKAAVDFWFVTELEKILMTDYQKIKGFLSKMVVTIIPSVLLTFIFTVVFESDLLIPQEDISETLLLFTFAVMLFLLNVFMSLIIAGLEKVLNLKSEYTVFINDDEWSIERLTKNNLLLLANKENEYLLIDEWKDKKIKKVVNKNSYTYKLYSINSNWQRFLGVSISLWILSSCTFIFLYDAIYSSLLFFIGCLSFLITLMILGNLVEYKREHAELDMNT